MPKQLKLLLGAVSFLTVMPTGARGKLTKEELGRSAAYFPIAGLMIGAIGLTLTLGLDKLMPLQATNVLLILYLVVISGGLHLDALADTVDGFAGGRDVKQRLAIMHKGASGPIGVVAVTLALLLEFTFLSGLAGWPRLLAILTVPALARWPMVWMAWRLPPVRRSGLGFIFARQVKIADVIGSGLTAVLICAGLSFWLGPLNLAILPVLLLAAAAGAGVSGRLIGGVTGDTLGAMVEVSEVILFLTIGLVAYHA